VAARGAVEPAGRQVPMGETTGAVSDSKNCKSVARWGEVAYGKTASSNTTCREITRWFVERLRQR
jgi:hypothetical protein